MQLSDRYLINSNDPTGYFDYSLQFLLILNIHVSKGTNKAEG